MKKTLVIILCLMLPLTWVWAAGDSAKDAVSPDQQEAKWQPVYGEKGDLLNPEPAIRFMSNSRHEGSSDPTINTVTDILLMENFSNPQSWDGSNPPSGGWAIIDSGTNRWNTFDWMRVASTSWGVAYARVYDEYAGSNEDWLISPAANFTAATACTLSFAHHFDAHASSLVDSGLVLLSDDGGSTWGDTVVVFAGADVGGFSAPFPEVFDISAFAAGKASIQVGFQYVKRTPSTYGVAWRMDDVVLNADGVPLVSENFDGAWGTYGDNPPEMDD